MLKSINSTDEGLLDAKKIISTEKLAAVRLCFGAALGMAFMVANTTPFIAAMLAIIVVGVYQYRYWKMAAWLRLPNPFLLNHR
ncbi:hypothetical protein [Shewanella sp.]|uniref:hypothetical protein n=1 Tax=Shewanella sp. TaxID=50422 RepID=UPI003567FCDF